MWKPKVGRIFVALIFVLKIKLQAQSLFYSTSVTLPSSIQESSGIEMVNSSSIWTHNDSGGQPELYEIDSLGNLIRTLTIKNASHVDWEDITADKDGHLYIGDVGNNLNSRTDLKIYIIDHPDSILNNSTNAQKINFTLSDQHEFPPAVTNLNYDIEAMVWLNDSLYLFSKNRTSPYTGYTKYYRLPAKAGTYVAELVDSFYGGSSSAWDYQICAADISPDEKQLFLLSHDKAWIFSCFEGSHFFSGSMQQLNLSSNTQKEGVCYNTDSTIYITDEYNGTGGSLYKLNLGNWAYKPYVFLGNDTTINSTLLVDAANSNCTYLWNTGANTQQLQIDTAGIYFVMVTAPNGCSAVDSFEVFPPIISFLNEPKAAGTFIVFPNPASCSITLKQAEPFESMHLQLVNQMGEIVFSKTIENSVGGETLMLPTAISNGNYILRILSKQECKQANLLINR